MTEEEKARYILHYIDALTRSNEVDRIEQQEVEERLNRACSYFEKIVMR